MNKFSPILALAFLLIPAVSYAVEGTCSSHGGVNCSSGMDIDGSAICNDGWRDSNELFDKTIECSAFQHLCTQTEWNEFSLKYDLNGQIEKINDNNSLINLRLAKLQVDNANTQNNSVFSGFAEGEMGRNNSHAYSDISAINAMIQSLQVNYSSSFYQAERECYLLGNSEYAKNQTSAYLEQIKLQTQTQPQFSSSDQYTPIQSVKIDFGPAMSNDERCSKLNLGTWYNTSTQNCDTCPIGKEKDPNSNSCSFPKPVVSVLDNQKTTTIKPRELPKPKVSEVIPVKIKIVANTTEATTSIQVIATTTISEPLPPPPPVIPTAPPEQPKTFWSKIIAWFKFW